MAKAKTKKKTAAKKATKPEAKAPDAMWVRVSPDSNFSAGAHTVGPFPTKTGSLGKKKVSEQWTQFDGTWATALQNHEGLAKNFEFSKTKPAEPKT